MALSQSSPSGVDSLVGTCGSHDPALLLIDEPLAVRCWKVDQSNQDTRPQICDSSRQAETS